MFLKNYKINFYDKSLIAIVALQLFGLYGGAFQPVRLLGLGLLFYLMRSVKKHGAIKYFKYEIFFLIFFCTYGFFLIFFTEDLALAIKDVIYLFIHSTIILSMILAADKALNPKIAIIIGWLIFSIVSVIFGVFELVTDWHFSNSKFDAGLLINSYGVGVLKNFAAFTFGNFNYYNLMLVYSLPFVMSSFFIFKNKKHHFLLYCLFIGITFITLANGSRGAFISLIIIFIYYLKFNPGKFNFMRIVIPLFLLFFLSKFLIANATFITSFIIKLSYLFEDNSRLNLISKGLELLVDSYFFGVGPGNLGFMYTKEYGMTLIAPHNLFIEILAQYGVFVFIGFIILLFKIFKRSKKFKDYKKFIIFGTFVLFPFSSVINSVYLMTPNLWILLGSLMIISNTNIKK